MRLLLPLLLIIFFGSSSYARSTLPVSKGEFVSLRIGYPYQTMTLMLRWEVDDIYLFSSTLLLDVSQTYTKEGSYEFTDVICISTCVRMRFYVGLDAPDNSEKRIETFASGFDGVLGLGPGSPIWDAYRWFEFDGKQLRLSNHNPVSTFSNHVFKSNEAGIFDGMLITAKEKQSCKIHLDLASDFTEMPFRLQHSALKHKWSLKIYDSEDPSRQTHMNIVPAMTKAIDRQNKWIETVRPLHMKTNNETMVLLGRLVLQQFVIVGNADTAQTWLMAHGKDFSLFEGIDYEGLFIILIIMIVLWALGIFESADRFNRFEETRVVNPPRGKLQVRFKNTPRLAPIFLWSSVVFPESNEHTKEESDFLDYVPIISFRHPNFVPFFVMFTKVCVIFTLLVIVFGFGFETSFKHFEWNVHDRVALYSTTIVSLICAMLLSGELIRRIPTIGSYLAITSLALCIWLLCALFPFDLVNSFLMVISSGLVALRWAEALYMVLTGSLYPLELIKKRRWVWILLIAAIAVWSAWHFAFYTVVFFIFEWNNLRVEAYLTGAAVLIFVIIVGASYMHIQERLAKITLKAYTLYGLFAHLQSIHDTQTGDLDPRFLQEFSLVLSS